MLYKRIGCGIAEFIDDNVHRFSDFVRCVSSEVLSESFGIQLASGFPRPLRVAFGFAVHPVWKGHSSLHTNSITELDLVSAWVGRAIAHLR